MRSLQRVRRRWGCTPSLAFALHAIPVRTFYTAHLGLGRNPIPHLHLQFLFAFAQCSGLYCNLYTKQDLSKRICHKMWIDHRSCWRPRTLLCHSGENAQNTQICILCRKTTDAPSAKISRARHCLRQKTWALLSGSGDGGNWDKISKKARMHCSSDRQVCIPCTRQAMHLQRRHSCLGIRWAGAVRE